MNEFDFLTGNVPENSISAQLEMAKALKRKSNLGMLAQLTGDKVLAPFGQAQSKQADQYAEQRELSRQKNVDDARSTKYQDAQIKQMEGVLAESMRAAKARDATDRRGQDLAAQSVLTKSLNQPSAKVPRLNEGDKKRLEVISGEVGAFKKIEDFYEKGGKLGAIEIAGIPIPTARALANTAASYGFGSKKSKESFAAKQEFDRLYTLASRSRLFGATLTEPERRAFEAANPTTRQTDAQIKDAMGAMKKVMAAKLRQTSKGLRAEGYSEEAIRSYGFDPDELQDLKAPDEAQGPDKLQALKAEEASLMKELAMK